MPPILATELISAMPPAAAAPLRKLVGKAQNVGSMLKRLVYKAPWRQALPARRKDWWAIRCRLHP